MLLVNVEIGSKTFQLSCGQGEENGLRSLASQVNDKMHQLGKAMGSSGSEAQLMAMTLLMLQDELNEAKSSGIQDKSNLSSEEKYDSSLIEAINAVSDYVDSIAERVEKA